MLLGDITVDQLLAVYEVTSFENQPELHALAAKIARTKFGRRLSEGEVAGITVGIKIGLTLAESEKLERMLGQ